MSVQDIIYITPLEFQKCKENVNVCHKILETYSKLLNSYDCFTKPDLVLLKFPTTIRNTQKHNNSSSSDKSFKNKNHHNGFRSFQNTKHSIHVPHSVITSTLTTRPPIKALKDNSNEPNAVVKRQLKGLLNIINKNNFSKIVKKIKVYVAEDVLDVITNIILDTACCQVFYISIFYNLLMEVKNFVDETGKDIIDSQIQKYVNDYIGDELYLYKKIQDDGQTSPENKYHEFCIVQKHKSLATSRHHVVMEMIKNNHCNDWTLQSYCDNLCYTITNLEYTIMDDNLEVNIDIMISMIKDLKIRDKSVRISQTTLNSIKSLLHNSQRLQFMMEDISK
jgi:hypothetical protein